MQQLLVISYIVLYIVAVIYFILRILNRNAYDGDQQKY